MATEKTAFDDWLKEKLWRDLIFRTLIWLFIAITGAYFSGVIDAHSANEYFKRQSGSVSRVVNIVGTAAIYLGIIALMFKDLEKTCPKFWGADSLLGKSGGLIRRLAGDMTLWTLGVLISTLVVAAVAGLKSKGTLGEWALFTSLYALLVGMCIIIAVFNILVRRAEALLPSYFDNSRAALVIASYSLVLIIFPFCVGWVRW